MLSQGVFAAGVYTTVGAAFAVANAGSGNWAGVRNGVGDATLTWGSGEQIDASQSVAYCTARGAVSIKAAPSAQADTTLQILAYDRAGVAAAEAIVAFMVLRTGP